MYVIDIAYSCEVDFLQIQNRKRIMCVLSQDIVDPNAIRTANHLGYTVFSPDIHIKKLKILPIVLQKASNSVKLIRHPLQK